MKKILTILFFIPVALYSQEFKVDCGNDTAFCLDLINGKIINYIGTKVKITNGIPPFKYSWTCNKVFYLVGYLTASDFLSDTTLENPRILGNNVKSSVRFYLTVIDSIGNKAMDSINVKFSQFIYEAGSYLFNINKGDSINFGTIVVGGGIPPLKYYWTPVNGVLDSSEITTWFKPDSSINYYQYIIDSAGCRSENNLALSINIIRTLIENLNSKITGFHQEGSKLFFKNPQNELAYISIYTLDGKNIFNTETKCTAFDTHNLLKSNSAYLCVLNIGGKQEACKFINYKR